MLRPQLRPLEVKWITQRGKQLLMLRDPTLVSERIALLPPDAAYILSLWNGERDVSEICAALRRETGVRVARSVVDKLIHDLDDALMLANERYDGARHRALARYRTASHREPALAGAVYPAKAGELCLLLERFLGALRHQSPWRSAGVRGLLSPHIDYERGGRVYAEVWHGAREAAREAEVAVIFGTDHAGGAGSVTLTYQSYATPLGVLPTDRETVAAVECEVGTRVFDDELHHRQEHSIELAAVWLQYVRGSPIPIVPVLVGSFHPYIEGNLGPPPNSSVVGVVGALRRAIAGKRSLVISAGDLAHVGPEFGDASPLQPADKYELKVHDEQLLRAVCEGAPDAFLQTLRDERDGRRVCGLPPTYMALSLLQQSSGHVVAYEQCPADTTGGSVVSIGGVLLR